MRRRRRLPELVRRHATAREQAKVELWSAEQCRKGSWPAAKKVLDEQSAALLRGDEKGWLGAVDPGQPKLRAYYQQLYAAMRALDVSGWDYFMISPRKAPRSTRPRPPNNAHGYAMPTCCG